MKTKQPQINKQLLALEKVIKIYWDEFKGSELKWENISENLKIYSGGEKFVYFKPNHDKWEEIGRNSSNSITFIAKEISEKSFNECLKFIRAELKNKILDPTSKRKQAIAELKAKLKQQREELKTLENINL